MRTCRDTLLVLGAIIGTPAAVWPRVGRAPDAPRVVQAPRMPRLVGLPRDSALTVLKNLRLTGQVITVDWDAAPGTVVRQSVDVGAPYERGQTVQLAVATGPNSPGRDDVPRVPDSVDVPPLRGQPLVAATIALGLAKLVVGNTVRGRDPGHDGKVIGQRPLPGTRVPAHSAVDLTVGFGVRVKVPNLVDHSPDDAARLLSGAGLRLGGVSSTQVEHGRGMISRQKPAAASTVMESTAVDVQIEVSTPPVRLPDVTKLPLAQARQVLDAAGFGAGLIDSIESGPPANLVLQQNPAGGTMVPPGSRVHLKVSSQGRVVHVPNLKDSSVRAAVRMLRDSGLVLGRVDSTPRGGVVGRVITQSPIADAQVIRGSAVSVRISSGARPISVPNVVDSTLDAAQSALEQRGLAVGVVTTAPQSRSDTVVVSQDPLPGTQLSAGAAVNLRLAVPQPRPRRRAPALIGRSRAQAESLVGAAGLRLGPVTLASSEKTDTVLAQDPPAGTTVDSGSAVSVRVGALRTPPGDSATVPNVTRQTVAAADSVLRRGGFRLTQFDTTASAGDAGLVVLQTPLGGARVPRGTPVRLAVGVRVWPPWLKILLTVLGLGALAAVIHKLWRKPRPKSDDENLQRRMKLTLNHDTGQQDIPGNADPTGSPALGLEARSDPGTQIVEGEES